MHPDWVRRRLARYAGRSRSTRWLIRRPERLLGWWLFVALLPLLGAVLTLVGLPWTVVLVWAVFSWLQLGVDRVYMPLAWRA